MRGPILILMPTHPVWRAEVAELKPAHVFFPTQLPLDWEHAPTREALEELFAICNGQPDYVDPLHVAMSKRYYDQGNRSLSVGDVVLTPEGAWVVAPEGWAPIAIDQVQDALEAEMCQRCGALRVHHDIDFADAELCPDELGAFEPAG